MSGRAELHVPVMLAEIVALLAPARKHRIQPLRGCVLVDCTLGLGGHAHACWLRARKPS